MSLPAAKKVSRLLWCPVHNRFKERYYVRYWWWKYRIRSCKKWKSKKTQSISIGSLNLFHNHVSGLWPDKKEQKAIAKRISKRLDAVDFPKKAPEKVCCVGGTCRAILNIVNYHFNKEENNRIITKEEFNKILKILLKRDAASRNYILKLCPDRVHTIIPGMLVVKEIIERLHCEKIWVSRYGVREGYLC